MGALEDVLTGGTSLGGGLRSQARIRNFISAMDAFSVLTALDASAGCGDTAQFGQVPADGSVAKVDGEGREGCIARVRRFACDLRVFFFCSVFLLQVSMQGGFPAAQQMAKMVKLVIGQCSHGSGTILMREAMV